MSNKYFYFLLFFNAFLFGILSCSNDQDTGHIEILEIDLDEPSVGFLAKSASKLIGVKTDAENLYFENTASWLTASYDKAREAIAISVLDNASLKSRRTDIIIKNKSIQDTVTVIQFGVEPEIILNDRQKLIDFKEQRIDLHLLSNVDLQAIPQATWINEVENLKNVTIEPAEYSFAFDIDALEDDLNRHGTIRLIQQEGDMEDSIIISQKVVINDYEPGNTESFEFDKKIEIASVDISPSGLYHDSQPPFNTIDNDMESMFHTPWGGISPTPIVLTFNFQDDSTILNYIVLHPRPAGTNGVFKSGTVEVKTKENPEFVQVAEFNFQPTNMAQNIWFASPVLNPVSVRINISDAYSQDGNYHVSLAELECFESRSLNALGNDKSFFTDNSFSELKDGIEIQDIAQIENPFIQNIAAHLLAGTYPSKQRIQSYEAYRDVFDLSDELKNSQYSQFENPTGIYFEQGDNVVVFSGKTNGESVFLRVRDFGQSGDDHSYNIREGLNILTMKGRGNGYLSYYTKDPEISQNIKIHIATGNINGFFDTSKHSNEYGAKLLDNAVSPILDLKGKYVQLAYTVNALKNNSFNHLNELVAVYDSIVSHQYNIMGLFKHNRVPTNHMLGRTTWSGYMFKDGYGAAFHEDNMPNLAHYERIKDHTWGPAHEFGHVNQVYPGMNWAGMGETSNNIYSSFSQFIFQPHNLRLENENSGGEIGGRFNAYLNNALINNQEYGLQGGPDNDYGMGDGGWDADHFVKLCPLWQMTLFFQIAGEGNSWHRPHFWGDIFEAVRTSNQEGVSHGQLQINFVKNACDAAQMDLSDFFTQTGFLQEVDKYFLDYSSEQKTITRSMIDDAIQHAAQYPKPPYENTMYYISGNSYKAFKNQEAIVGAGGVQVNDGYLRVEHSHWKNVIVFETYNGNELIHLTMYGTGNDGGQSFTNVSYPEGSTRVEAVGYDGERVLTYGNR